MTFLEALDHPALFGGQFVGESWRPWRTIEAAIFGLPLALDQRALFGELAGGREPPERPCKECWIAAGRRSGKSRKAAALGVYLSTVGAELAGYRERLAPGEKGLVLVLAVDKAQARLVLDYARALLKSTPMLAAMVERDGADEIELSNRMSLVIAANDFRSIRGRSIAAAIFDECSFWRSELTANPDIEIYRAVRPSMASMPNSLLIGISSPYRRTGLLWQKFRRHFGKSGDVLVVQAPTKVLNPGVDQQLIADAYEDDPQAAASEWGAEFRQDLADFVSREVVESLVSPGVRERAPRRRCWYFSFCDPAGGSGGDSYTIAIALRVGQCAELVALRERRPPFSPEAVTDEYAQLSKSYGLFTVTGDVYAGQWPAEQFQKRGISYRPSGLTKSQIYLESLPLLNSGRVDLLDDDRLISQICQLERRTARGGRDSIDHAPNSHDDVANSALGALRGVLAPAPLPLTW